MITEIKLVTQEEFEYGTDYTNHKANPLVYVSETNRYLTYSKIYNTYATNKYWYKNKGSYDNPIGRLIYVRCETESIIHMIQLCFEVSYEPFITQEEFRDCRLKQLDEVYTLGNDKCVRKK